MIKMWVAVGSFLMALAVAAGAFGAHALKARLDPYSLSIYEKANYYHFLHAVAILIITSFLASDSLSSTALHRINYIFLFGIIVFSGSLYALSLTGIKALGAITPIGGIAFIAAWLYLTLIALRQ